MDEITLDELTDGAIAELKERKGYNQWRKDSEISDYIHEIADSRVPIYYAQLIKMARYDLWLATWKPTLWPAFDGEPTAANIIAANVYEHLVEKLNEQVRDCEELLDLVE